MEKSGLGNMYLSQEIIDRLKEGFKTPSEYNKFYTKQAENRLKRWVEISERKNKQDEQNKQASNSNA